MPLVKNDYISDRGNIYKRSYLNLVKHGDYSFFLTNADLNINGKQVASRSTGISINFKLQDNDELHLQSIKFNDVEKTDFNSTEFTNYLKTISGMRIKDGTNIFVPPRMSLYDYLDKIINGGVNNLLSHIYQCFKSFTTRMVVNV